MGLNIGIRNKILNKSKKTVITKRAEQEVFVTSVNPAPNDWGGTSSWPMTILTAADDCYFLVKLPKEFKTLLEAAIVILPDATETIQWDIEFEAAGKGELENQKTNNDLNVTQDVVLDTITELDLMKSTAGNPTGLFPKALKANDYMGLWFQSDTANIQVLGLRLKFR